MRIGIVAPFNPGCIKEYFEDNDVPFINNGATSVNTLVLSLLQEGHTLKVFTISNDEIRLRKLEGNRIEVYLVPTLLSPLISSFKHHLLLDTFYIYRRLSRTIAGELKNLDVLHAHWTYDFALACVPFASIKPVLVSVRDWAPKQYKLQTNFIDKVVWKFKLKKFKRVMGDKRICYVANSEYTLNLILQDYPGSTTALIPNPIKKELVINSENKKYNNNSFISIAQDLDDKGKNLSPLITAFSEYKTKHHDAVLHLVGCINKEGYNYTNWSDNKLLDGVVFHGNLSHDKLMLLMDEMFCLVHPSLIETFGNVLLEAMARGVVCIGGDNSGAVPYVLNNGKAGVLCNVRDSNELVMAMDSLNNESYYKDLRKSAESLLRNNYISDVIARKHISLYEKCIG